jgi:hypothetical protein
LKLLSRSLTRGRLSRIKQSNKMRKRDGKLRIKAAVIRDRNGYPDNRYNKEGQK